PRCFSLCSYSAVPLLLFFSAHAARRDLHSFPTRRSSDLHAAMPPRCRVPLPRHQSPGRSSWCGRSPLARDYRSAAERGTGTQRRSEEHTSELQSRENLVCRLLLEKKKEKQKTQKLRALQT